MHVGQFNSAMSIYPSEKTEKEEAGKRNQLVQVCNVYPILMLTQKQLFNLLVQNTNNIQQS